MRISAIHTAIVDGRLSDISNEDCQVVAVDTEARLPTSVVLWDIASSDRSVIVLDKTFYSNNRVSFYSLRLAQTLPLIEEMHRSGALSKGVHPLNLDDAPVTRGLTFCSCDPTDTLIPDVEFTTRRGYQELAARWNATPVPWSGRLPVVFWRGGTSGRPTERGWRFLPRIQLCEIAATRRDLFDVGIVGVAQLPAHANDELSAKGLMRAHVPPAAHIFFKYHIDIDGNTNAWAGFFIKLLSGSPVLKVTSPHGFRQWYYDRLIPWKHYVPVESDMSDLVEKSEWLSAHPKQAEGIGTAAQALAQSMTFESEAWDAAKRIGRKRMNGEAAQVDSSAGSPPPLATEIIAKLYGRDVYSGFCSDMTEDLQGWNSRHSLLTKLIERTRPRIVIDVGVWKGASTVFIADLLRQYNIDGAVIAVDTFLGNVEHSMVGTQFFDLVVRKYGRPCLYEQFLTNVIAQKATAYIVPLPQTSVAAARILHHIGIRADVIHIDAAHDYDAVFQDAKAYWSLLTPGGYLIGDDYHESWPGVIKGANEFAAHVGVDLETDMPKWFVRKQL